MSSGNQDYPHIENHCLVKKPKACHVLYLFFFFSFSAHFLTFSIHLSENCASFVPFSIFLEEEETEKKESYAKTFCVSEKVRRNDCPKAALGGTQDISCVPPSLCHWELRASPGTQGHI